MKDILIDGHRILTTDEIADAVITYAQLLLTHGQTDVVEFPSFHDGMPASCTILLGGSGTLAVVDAPMSLTDTSMGSERACAEITRRSDALAA